MPQPDGGPTAAADGGDAFEDISSLLPLRLARPQIIPPAPTRRAAAIDFLHDFGGAAWIAYGAAHLLVVSHLPSPEPRHDAHSVGPFFRQVVELPVPCADDGGRPVSAVAWCPAHPSEGELAVARGDWVWLYAPSAGNDPGSFWWMQTVGILQSFAVGAIGWTGSGDGLVVAGIEVVLWIRKSTCWEAAWRSRAEVPQSLVSASWFSERYVASAAGVCAESLCRLSGEESSSVLVHHCNGTYGITKVRLCHPQPVSVIQWRPSTLARMKNRDSHPWRDILLTCCLDGTIRLWSEIDNGRAKRSSKDIHDTKNWRLSFHVITVIEINQCLKGNLGRDVSIAWAMEFGGMVSRNKGDGDLSLFEGYENNTIGRCEWLICVGPKSLITFWAIHCLDDMSPLRFPRVTMWKKQNLKDFTEHDSYNSDLSSNDWPILVKAAICRNWQFGPPILCSLIQLLPNNSFCWSQLSNPTMNDLEGRSLNQNSKEKSLSCFVSADLYQDGHTGTIIQLAVHPYSCEIELAASLDSNGFLLIWSLSTPYSCTLGMQMFIHPAWKLLGKIILQDLSPNTEYSCLRWAPSVMEDNKFVLLGHKDGVDCFVIGPCGEGGKIICRKILTVPFSGHDHVEGPPSRIFATPIASTSERSFVCNSFLLFAVWIKKFQALSWKVVLHSEDPSQNSKCDSNENNLLDSKGGGVKNSFTGRMYHGTADLVSSTFPDSQDIDQVTSYALVSLDNSVISVQQLVGSLDNLSGKSFPYHLATGCSDGTLKLWRISHSETRTDYGLHFPWELVGAFIAHEGPVSAVSLSSCGSRIATVTMTGPNSITTLHIWESICLVRGGGFLLEDVISFNEPVVALNWLSIGNGQLLLGVCTANELRVYSERSIDQTPVESEKRNEVHIWFCIASSPITYFVPQDFLWGPKAALMLVYERLFSLFTPWLFRSRKEYHNNHPSIFVNEANHSFPCTIYRSRGNSDSKRSSDNELINANGHNDRASYLKMPKEQCDFDTKNGLCSMLHIAGRFRGMLAVYHPKALIQYLYSGNWKRAYVILKHLVGYIKSDGTSVTNSEINKSQISFQGTPEIPLSTYFEENMSKDLRNKVVLWGQETAVGAATWEYQRSLNQSGVGTSVAAALENTSISTLSKSEITGLIDVLENFHEFASIKDIDRNEILAIVELLGEISDSRHACAYESLDEPGRRFWVAVRFQRLHYIRKLGRLAAAQEFVVKSDLIASAFQSDCQDLLFSSVFSEEPSWVEMRNLGVGFWFTNAMQLRTRMEKLARSQYLKRKDPKDCALLYLALNRVQVLAGLFKVSKDEKNKALVGFLSRNFQEEKNKAAALKNAYFLMGRHELELAIAFFLLGGDPSSAITVCAKNLGDEQLALVLCRLIEGCGGPLERQLISNFLLPNAIDKGDYWLSSLLEWTLGNYSRSLKRLFYSHTEPVIEQSATMCNCASFSDANIAQHCVILLSKNCFRNSIGDYVASVATKFALFMAAKALNKCGLPLEALECLSSFRIESKDEHGSYDIENHEIFHGLLNPFSSVSCNWLLGGVACHVELNSKMNMALLYIGKLLRYHPYYRHANLRSSGEPAFHDEYVSHQEEFQVEEFNNNLNMAVSMFEHKHSVKSIYLAEMILVFTCNKELLFLGYQWLQSYMHQEMEHDVHSVDSYMLNSAVSSLLLKASKEISHIAARSVVSSSFADSTLNLSHKKNLLLENNCCNLRPFCLQRVLYSMRTVRPLLKLYRSGSVSERSTLKTSDVLVLLEFFIYFTSAWFKGNLKGLILMIYPILNSFTNGQSTFGIIAGELMELLHQNPDLVGHDTSGDVLRKFSHSNGEKGQDGESESLALSIPDEEKWLSIAACLWIHLSNFAEHQFTRFLATDGHETESTSVNLINLFPMVIAKLLMTSLMYISSSFTKQFAAYLRQKTLKGLPVPTLSWLKEFSQSLRSVHSNQEMNTLILPGHQDREFMLKILWEISVSPREICDSFLCGRVNSFCYNSEKLPRSWQDLHESILAGNENSVSPSSKMEDRLNSSLLSNEEGLLLRSRVSGTYGFPETRKKDTNLQRDITSFHRPKEVLKRTGELVEAICFNSVNEQQVALLSNRKGLVFFDVKSEEPSRKDTEYIWSVSDWPQDGWAGCESIPIPTYVSPGIGLGSKRGAQLGLGGATLGLGSLARPGRDLTGGGAFGIPGYAGIGASGLGWGEMEEFEEYVDPPATVENIRSRALSRHPSKPFFLVGSSNTHVYLWEFGKDRATATYGILPAANVPPPYALASVSALQFDHCGQRFATAALDGTVCTWQVEVGGRSNVHPIESTLCFNNHASDVAYLASSGSVLAAAGNSSSGVNVIIRDTLAPPATSQASLVCHEGGARSLSVFDNDIGSSSISPLIVTGGKSGDVGLHDFRFIATGRTKRHRHSSNHDLKSSGGSDTASGTKSGENVNGMIWYIPKAHLGSITRISTIPNTSLFLTGSKDGDVKLWDAKRCELVHHWQKLHDRHTFLQPNSRGFGGVVRAAVTDIQVLSQGFLTCGGDGSVKLICLG